MMCSMNYSARVCNDVQYGVQYECYILIEFILMFSMNCSARAYNNVQYEL